MKNTRLYFDKQFTPIIQAELYINFLGELTSNISNDLVPILSPISYNTGNQMQGLKLKKDLSTINIIL